MIFGIQVVHITKVGQHQDEYAQLPTFGRTLTRFFLHLVDMGLIWGWFRPVCERPPSDLRGFAGQHDRRALWISRDERPAVSNRSTSDTRTEVP